MSFPRYPEYKDSGVEWLGEVPGHWQVLPIRTVAKLESGHTPSRSRPDYWENCDVPWFTLADVWQIREGADYVFQTKESVSEVGLANSSARLLPAGTVILSRTASVGFSAIMGLAMATTQDFANWVCGSRVLPKYLLHTFRAMGMEFERLKFGSTHNTIYMPDIAAFRFALPSIEEQSAIVTFVDREVAKIDALVAEQQSLIALLKEKRQALISHAVTKGLDPDVPMKDSGVAWLGEVPAQWVVLALSRIATERCDGPFGSGIKSEHYTDSGALVVRLQNIRSNGFHVGEPVFLELEYFEQELKRHEVVPGDVLIAGLGDENNVVGRACVAPAGISPALVKADCFRFRLDGGVVAAAFVAAQLNVSAVADAGRLANGSTRSRIPLSVMATRVIALPPLAEQVEIVAFVERERAAIDELVSEAETTIALLQERRTALISAAVTGKIDVRRLAVASADRTPEPA